MSDFPGNSQFARLITLATGSSLENVPVWLSSSIREIYKFSSNTQKEIHDRVLYSDVIQQLEIVPFVDDLFNLDDYRVRKNYVWIMMNVIDFSRCNVVEWHFDAADQICEPLYSQRITYPYGRILYRCVVGVISFLEPHLHCCLEVKKNSPISNGDIHPILQYKFDESVREFLDGTLTSSWDDIEITDVDEDPVIWKGDKRIFPSLSSSYLTLPSVDISSLPSVNVSSRSLEGVIDYATLVSLHFPDTNNSGILTALQSIRKEAERMGNWRR
jgi:hypothetical protein